MGIPTTTEEQYKRLRSYLNPFIKGPNVDAVLNALAASNASYLINSASAINDQLYIVTASGQYLDERLAQYGISRPSAVGLSDDTFRQIGIAVKNRKQVRDLIDQLLDAIFGDEFTKATNSSTMFEPYDLSDGDTLIVNFDDHSTATIIFSADQFTNIHAALAQEVADAIASSLSTQGVSGAAIANNNGNGNFVELISSTIGPASSVTVLGGSAQNELVFPASVAAGGNMSTQWTLSLQPGGLVRFTWSAGANPNLGRVVAGNYVNIFGGGFASSPNEGSFTIVKAVGGGMGIAYFEVSNPIGTSGIVTQGADDAVLFFNPVRESILSKYSYAAIFSTQNRVLEVFLPATTKVVRRSRIGSAHLHDPSNVQYVFNAQPAPGDVFHITSTTSITAGASFVIGVTIPETIANMVTALTGVEGISAIGGNTLQTDGYSGAPLLTVWQDDPSLTLVGTYSGSQAIVPSGPLGDINSEAPNQPGPYMFDTTQPFTVGSVSTLLTQELDGSKAKVFTVEDSTNFPDSQGYIIFGYGTQTQEGPVPYISTPSNNTILISPTYTLQNTFQPGTNVSLISAKSPPVISSDGLDYPFYITDVVAGRTYAQDLINSVAATGITIVFTILYPNSIGLGKWGTQYDEIAYVYGGDPTGDTGLIWPQFSINTSEE